MVHALGETHRLLRPMGKLIDIHPLPSAPVLAVFCQGKMVFSEECPSQGGESYREADRAIEDAIQRGLFAQGESTVVDFLTHAPSAAELDRYLTTANAFAQEPRDAERELRWANLIDRADKALGAEPPGVEAVLIERARITSLRPLA
jgi:hypothetical protein